MITERQRELARRFSRMHINGGMFVLPNVWDAGSAFVFEKQGFKAVATSSAGVAYALGYPDGEDITLDDLALCVEQIARRIDIPLSVDFERGYGETAEQVKKNAKSLLYSGAVGFNIEDGLADGTLEDNDLQIVKIKSLYELKKELDISFVINARTCAYWLDVADEETNLKIALDRGNTFKAAGADCVFIPGAMDKDTVAKLVNGINAPINIVLNPKFYDFKQLESIGVKRLSMGSAPVRSVFNNLIGIAQNLKNNNIDNLLNHTFSYDEANEYFQK